MKKIIILSIALLAGFLTAEAQDINTIAFTWETEGGAFEIEATANKEFTVNWGDGSIETKTGGIDSRPDHIYATRGEYSVTIAGSTGDCRFTFFSFVPITLDYQFHNLILTGCTDLLRLYCYNGRLTELDLTGCPGLTHLGCSDNQLTKLNLSGCPKLAHLICNNNQLEKLDLTGCSDLQSIMCYNNRLQLSDLFAAYLLIGDQPDQNAKMLGTQNLQPQIATPGEELFGEQSVFNGIFTNYSVTQNGIPASGNDFTVIDGKLIFNVAGKYTVRMTNDAIVSQEYTPAEVIVEITVEKSTGISTPNQNIFTVYPNPATTEIHVKLTPREAANYTICNTAGQKVLQDRLQEGAVINVESLSKGIYYIYIDDQKNTISSFIKN